MGGLIDLTGQRFGQLVVLHRYGQSRFGDTIWWCRCDCGQHTQPLGSNLRKGYTKSCGCGERAFRESGARTRHSEARRGQRTREYRVWTDMIARCTIPSATSWPNYGGRGITVCDRWRTSYEAFLADMGRCPPGHSIERNDNDGPYEPTNCRWATRSEQMRNRRRPHP